MALLVCECDSLICLKTVSVSEEEAEEVKKSGLEVIVSKCLVGPERDRVLVERRNGYSLYK